MKNNTGGMIPVESSNIESIGYNEDTHRMLVEFKNKSVYLYLDVDNRTHTKLMEAESIGSAFNTLIRDKFEFEKVI